MPRDVNNQTMLAKAAEKGHEAVMKLLLEKGAVLEYKDIWGKTPLSWAAENGYETILKILLEKGAELETKNSGNQTPLSKATTTRNSSQKVCTHQLDDFIVAIHKLIGMCKIVYACHC